MIKSSILTIFLYAFLQDVGAQELQTTAPERTVRKDIRSEKVEGATSGKSSYRKVNSEQGGETYSVDKYGVQRKHDKAYFQEQLSAVEESIRAIEVKEDYVRSIPEEHALAQENGWYENMKKTKERLREERIDLRRKIEESD